ncbi:unnamed protein product [Rotaria sordida]|uniref:Sugar phosphate transporter domain-containing protein n=1 Tax=Rotaria sordida TaxID=392033 RepID=A0A818XNH3_9BILA|nr:unnamed protein product [Rotaria sordida]
MLSNINISILQLCILILSWYFISSLANIIGKQLLTIFPYPFSVTLTQLFHGWIYSIPLLRLIGIQQSTDVHSTRIYYITILVPLAIGKLLSQLTSQISLRLVTISYTHTVKALMPLFTVILSRIILDEEQSITIYLSLLPIIIGVIITSLSELSFDIIGLISALFTLLSVLSKLSWCLLIPFWFLLDGSHMDIRRELTPTVIYFILIDGLCNFIYNVLAFTMISYLSSLSYAIASSTKRITIIIMSIIIFHNRITYMNLFGISLTLIGVILYNKMKYNEKKQQLLSLNTISIQPILLSSLP